MVCWTSSSARPSRVVIAEFSGLGGRRLLRPDAFLALGVGDYEWRWFCEIDRGSESVPVILRKCHLYADYYQSGQEQAKHGGVFPTVCWIVPDKRAPSGCGRPSTATATCLIACSWSLPASGP